MLVNQEKQKREHVCRYTFEQDQALAIAAEATNSPHSLLFQFELELLRQKCSARSSRSTNGALRKFRTCRARFALRTEHDKQLNELQRRFDDKIRFFTQ